MAIELNDSTTAVETLQRHWGYSTFRPMQQEVIASILSGRDTLALMPTGGGKSITFQVPALMCSGLCLVISPLVALMKDQVDALRSLHIKAAYLHSGLSRREAIALLDNCLYGDYKFLYVSPERLANETFLLKLSTLELSFIVVDESHCVSQWGYDFRPAYLKIADFRALVPHAPVLALTATAPPRVVSDIMQQLAFREGYALYQRSFYRKALSYVVRETADKPRTLVHILQSVGGSALVYVRSRQKAADYAALLTHQGISADFYHAGLSSEVKTKRQNAWQEGSTRVMVCTNAFGMGINKNDVRLVIHPDLPSSPESYYQEAGRAGRDNLPAYAVLLFDPNSDRTRAYQRLESNYPPIDLIRRIYHSIGCYFEVAVGSGKGSLHEFNLQQFCHTFRYSYIQVLASLQLLGLAGYMNYEEDKEFSSRLLILNSRNSLYNLFEERHSAYDTLIETLLRLYTGLFSEYAFIDEEVIAQRSGLPKESIYPMLIDLDRWGVVDYVPGKRSTYIQYIDERVESSQVLIGDNIYQQRFDGEHDRLEVMLQYAEEQEECRVLRLMEYFGEAAPKPCGLCDYCRSHPPHKLSYRAIDRINDYLTHLRQEGRTQVSLNEIAQQCTLSLSHVREALQFLLSEYAPLHLLGDQLRLC